MSKQRILEIAQEFFASKGYDATSMEDIAQVIGIKKPSLYAHFPGKEAIFRATINQVLGGYRSHLEVVLDGVADMELPAALSAIATRYIGYFQDPATTIFWLRLYLSPPEFMRTEIQSLLWEPDIAFMARLDAFMAERTQRGELRARPQLSLVFASLLSGMAMNVAFGLMPASNEQINGTISVLLEGMGTQS